MPEQVFQTVQAKQIVLADGGHGAIDGATAEEGTLIVSGGVLYICSGSEFRRVGGQPVDI
jgi:hypothetical protein